MLNIDGSYTDAHGITHHSPVVVVTEVYYNYGSNIRLSGRISADSVTYEPIPQGGSISLYFNAVLFKDVAAMQSGKRPLTVRDENGNDSFVVPLSEAVATTDLVAVCEQYLLDRVIVVQKLESEQDE